MEHLLNSVHSDESDGGSHIAIVLIHGIGSLAEGDVVAAATKGIRAALPEIGVPTLAAGDFDGANDQSCLLGLPRARLRWRASVIDLIEFPWAGIAGKIRLRHPVRAMRQITELLKEFPSMAVGADSAKSLKV